jgi:hypothetical protein
MSRRVLRPGYITSQYNGQRHFVDLRMLAWLYAVHIRDCVVVPMSNQTWQPLPGDEILAPRPNYDYPTGRRP